ncbi:hypothetical protein [Streptomyces sp. NPDC031705]|uniref:hypothetical protein n=1 Tax=Streptomyces sp. NPDC031705 TaxID=3155729 RepID=UPI003406847A
MRGPPVTIVRAGPHDGAGGSPTAVTDGAPPSDDERRRVPVLAHTSSDRVGGGTGQSPAG